MPGGSPGGGAQQRPPTSTNSSTVNVGPARRGGTGTAFGSSTPSTPDNSQAVADLDALWAQEQSGYQQQIANINEEIALRQAYINGGGGGGGGAQGIAQRQALIDLEREKLAIQRGLAERQLAVIPRLFQADKRAARAAIRSVQANLRANNQSFRQNVRALNIQGRDTRQRAAIERRDFTNNAITRGAMGASGTQTTYDQLANSLANAIGQIRVQRDKNRTDYRATKSNLRSQRVNAITNYHKSVADYSSQLRGLRAQLQTYGLDDRALQLQRELAGMSGGGGGGMSMGDAVSMLRLTQAARDARLAQSNAQSNYEAQRAGLAPSYGTRDQALASAAQGNMMPTYGAANASGYQPRGRGASNTTR